MPSQINDNISLIRKLEFHFNGGPQPKSLVFVKYCMDEKAGETYILISNPFTKIPLRDIDNNFVDFKRLKELQDIHDDFYKNEPKQNKFEIWNRLAQVFIRPLLKVLGACYRGYVFLLGDDEFGNVYGMDKYINLPYIYDLSFLFSDNPYVSGITFINVSDSEPIRFITKLLSTLKPFARDMDIIFGFPPDDDTPVGKFREQAFADGMSKAHTQGARIHMLETDDISIFEKLFSQESKGRVVQLFAHFHSNRILSRESGKHIRVVKLKLLVEKMLSDGKLRSDICLHAATCTNFNSLKMLYEVGIKSIYYSSINLQTVELAGIFWELFHGHNALKINCNFPYLDGESFIFEAWANVSRCFYRNTFLNNNIEIL